MNTPAIASMMVLTKPVFGEASAIQAISPAKGDR